MESILAQNYQKLKVIVSVDNSDDYKYVTQWEKKYDKVFSISTENLKNAKLRTTYFPKYKRRFPPAYWNLYFNRMYEECLDGFIIILDDDDAFYNEYSLNILKYHIKTEFDLVFWRVLFPGGLIPNDIGWLKRPIPANISGIGLSFHTRFIKDAQWQPYTFGDFRLADNLYDKIPRKIYLNNIITKVNRRFAGGYGRRDDL